MWLGRRFSPFTPNIMAANIISRLKALKSSESDIRQEIISYVMEYYSMDEDVESFFRNLLTHGCVSGMVGSMIYYVDTHAFFERHYDEIEELRHEFEDEMGISLKIEHDLKNELAWFGYEEVARRLADDLDIEW